MALYGAVRALALAVAPNLIATALDFARLNDAR
jgi:hypothetical protein